MQKGSKRLTPEDKDLLSRVLAQEMLDQVVRHGKDFRSCRRGKNCLEHCDFKPIRVGAGFTFDDKQSFQAFGVVFLKHLEDLVTQKNITGGGRPATSGLPGLCTSPNVSIAGFHKCFRPSPSTS